ncbi:MAG: tetraacyldisaccharide 4'-kinase [Synergistaceae bacterium]
MSKLIRSYLKYARGEQKYSPWMILYPTQAITKMWMRLRIALFKRGIFSVTDPVLPVVSIGNNSMGGTNKTPMTEWVVKQFLDAGIKAGLVSRGYKAKGTSPIWIGQNDSSMRREIAGDEPLMLSRRIPNASIVVSKDRIMGVKLLAELGAEVAVTDDTFQHRKMARDVDIVLVDSTCPFGNGNVIPAGVMREPMSAFTRADILVITKANQVSQEDIAKLKKTLSEYIDENKIFTAEIVLESWIRIENGEEEIVKSSEIPDCKYLAFSAIGNPPGFYNYMNDKKLNVVACRSYTDHHMFKPEDIARLEESAIKFDAAAFVCTEKDIFNLPRHMFFTKPLYVPRIKVKLDNELKFKKMLYEKLQPKLIVASNGYGEDAIGVILAKKLRERFKSAEVKAFAFVGAGKHYSNVGIPVVSPVTDMPSGGIVKYSVADLLRDIRHGLGNSVRRQLECLHEMTGMYRTPVCVGDVYLTLNMLWGQGMRPILVATAKSVHLHGHLKIEEWLLKHRTRFVWARDIETARALQSAGVKSGFDGNPVMDLTEEIREDDSMWDLNAETVRVLLLPGSRPRAYDDAKLILDAAVELSQRVECQFVFVVAPTIDIDRMTSEMDDWAYDKDNKIIKNKKTSIRVYDAEVVTPARKADILIGLGGTANQLCAGLGIPVISIIETGKLRQKKLLKEAEILVNPKPQDLAETALKVLSDPKLYEEMSNAGVKYLGKVGALSRVVEYCAKTLGWDNRCYVYEKYGKYIEKISKGKEMGI